MKIIIYLLLILLLLLGIIALVGAMVILYDEVLDVIEKYRKKYDGRHRRP